MRSQGSGHISQRAPGRFLVRWTANGERHSKVVPGTKREAEKFLTGKLDEIAKGRYVAPTGETLREYLDSWLAGLDGGVKPCARTVSDYRKMLARNLPAEVGNLPLEEITPAVLRKLYADVRAGIVKRGGDGSHTAHALHRTLRTALNAAVIDGRLVSAPTARVKSPPKKSKVVRWLTEEEAERFRAAAAKSMHAAFFDFLLGTGCRPGEALALHWRDVDLDAGTAEIEHALSRPNGEYELREPKTTGSRRSVDLNDDVAAALRAHKGKQDADRVRLAEFWEDRGLVFPGPLGDFAGAEQLNRGPLKTVLRHAGLPPEITLYSLRHTFATHALAGGATVHEVASAMGTSPELIFSTYGHALPKRRSAVFTKAHASIFSKSVTTPSFSEPEAPETPPTVH